MADYKKVIARTVIHRTLEPGKPGDKEKGIRPVPPRVQIIQPNTVFNASTVVAEGAEASEFDELMEAGAIREPEKGEKVQVDIENVDPVVAAKTAAKSSGKGSAGSTKTSENAGTTKSGSQAGQGGSGDGNDLV